MTTLDDKKGVWFVYDGDCPICNYAAHVLRIKKAYGELRLLNGRESNNDPLLQEIISRNLDLDEGMVIYANGAFYHGKSALRFMAAHGNHRGIFNFFNKVLFWSDTLSTILYPWMRGIRNMLLHYLKKTKIDNLNLKNRPIFAAVFADSWSQLPQVLKKHYANRPYSHDQVTVEGTLTVSCRSYMNILRPFYRILGSIPIATEDNVPVTVHFRSTLDTKEFHFDRIFYFKHRKPYHFHSQMVQTTGNEVIEIMRFGIFWRTAYHWTGTKIALIHKGYGIKIFGHLIPLPLTPLLGRGDAEEIAVDDNHFDMRTSITHTWFGEVYSYAGRFKVSEEA